MESRYMSSGYEAQEAVWALQEAVGSFAKALRKGTYAEVLAEASAIVSAVASAVEARAEGDSAT